MYFLLSPAKNLNEKRDFTPKIYSQPPLLAEAEILMNDVRPLARSKLPNSCTFPTKSPC